MKKLTTEQEDALMGLAAEVAAGTLTENEAVAIALPPTGREECEARGHHEYRPLTSSLSWQGGVMVERRCDCGAVEPK